MGGGKAGLNYSIVVALDTCWACYGIGAGRKEVCVDEAREVGGKEREKREERERGSVRKRSSRYCNLLVLVLQMKMGWNKSAEDLPIPSKI